MYSIVYVDKSDSGIRCRLTTRFDKYARTGCYECKDKPDESHGPEQEGPTAHSAWEEGEGQRAGETEHLACCCD